jgi:DNA-binding HxlR family transcriptional regulator
MQIDPILDSITTGGIASGEVLVDILNESKKNALGTMLVREHEMTSVLVVASREGSILSGNLRKAWDGDKVESRSRAKGHSFASGYNMAFLGGATPVELEKRLTANDIANGWANRFLWFWSEKRDGGFKADMDDTLDPGAASYVRDCIEYGRSLGGSMLIRPRFTMALTAPALARMEAMADALDVRPIGAIGALRQRMPAHVLRLAMIAAILDQTNAIDEPHVAFGEAMTAYAVESMRAVFGLRLDDPVAMLVLEVLVQVPDGWMNTTNLRAAVGGKDHSRLMSALRLLIAEGLVVRVDRPSLGGRPGVGYTLTSRL